MAHLFEAAIFFLFHKASQAGWKLPCSYPTIHISRHLILVLLLSANNSFTAFRKRKGRKEEAQPNTYLETMQQTHVLWSLELIYDLRVLLKKKSTKLQIRN